MKKYLYLFSLIILLSPINMVWASIIDFSKPVTNNYGGQSPILGASILYPQGGGTGIGSALVGDIGACLKVSNNSPFTYILGTCGGGGSGGGTWSTTTSTVSGRLINYPNNNSDIVTIGSNSTTTAKVYIDPNISQTFFNSRLNIGKTVPSQLTGFGSGYYDLHYSTSTNDVAGWDMYNTSTGSQAAVGIFMQNANSPLGGIGASQTYYGGMVFSGKNWNGPALGFGALPANSLGVYATDGSLILASATSTGRIDFYTGIGSFMGGVPDFTMLNNGNIGIATSSPYTRLSVVGPGGVVAENYTATSTTATSTFAGGVQSNLLNVTSTTATSTFANGINLTKGCFSINGSCITGSSVVGSSQWITNGSNIYYSTGNVGIGTSSPYAALSVVGISGVVAEDYTATSTTATSTFNGALIVGNNAGLIVNPAAPVNTLYVDSIGNIAIGTTTPRVKLTVVGTSALPASSGTTQTGILRLSSNTGPTLTSTLDFGSYNTTGAGWIQATDVNNLATNRSLALNPNGGSVGIGTAAPQAKTEIVSTSAGAMIDALLLTNSSQTINTETGLFFAPTNSGGVIRGARISGLQEDGGNKIGLKFYTGLGAAINEVMRLSSVGNLGIGTTSPYARLSVEGTSALGNSALAGYFIATTSTASIFPYASTTALTVNSVNVIPYVYRSFTIATTTAWTGTSTPRFIGIGQGEVFDSAKCSTDVGSLNVDIYQNVTHLSLINASTTVNKVTFNTNNTIANGATTTVTVGTPVSSPTQVVCTIKSYINVPQW